MSDYAQRYYAEHKERMKRQTVEARRRRKRLIAAEPAQQRPSTLSPREQQVLALLVEGLLTKEIAAQLSLAESTVKAFIGRAYVKLGVRNRAEAVRVALERGGGR